MPTEPIRFNGGAAYDRFMGACSRLPERAVLHGLAPVSRLRWLDVGCANGAFTALIAEGCQPLNLTGLDPSPAQLAFARQQPAHRHAT